MAPAVETQYKDLLNPVKDIEKSFTVNIAELLEMFVSEFLNGGTMPNFNSAALLLQGSASVYGKKVEYLHNLATQLHNSLLTKKKGDQQQAKKETKEKEKKEEKLSDPFLSVEFKIGKNLSCLRKKNLSKTTTKKPIKKKESSAMPVHLLSNDTEEKGGVLYDVRGEAIGNKGDCAINRCRIISSGWLLLPAVNPNLVPSLEALLDYDDNSDLNDACVSDDAHTGDSIARDCIADGVQASPDEGFGSYPPSSGVQESTPGTDIISENNIGESPMQNSDPTSTDDGICSTPSDAPISDTPNDVEMSDSPDALEGNENIPAEGAERSDSDPAPQPVRHSVRRALKTCQLAVEDDPLAGLQINKDLLVRKKIAKKNVRRLPSKLKMGSDDEEVVSSISSYCARVFFNLDEKSLYKSLLNFEAEGLSQNSSLAKRLFERIKYIKDNPKKKKIDPIEDEREIDVEGLDNLPDEDANEDDETLCAPFDDNDIQIDHNIILPTIEPEQRADPATDEANAESIPEVPEIPLPDVDLSSPDISHIAHEECENYIREVHQFFQNSDITQRVYEWEQSIKPFLDELNHRESFDINLYGSRILNAFQDNNRKQTMTFKQFCKGKEKWEIHRYFMALLPLANIGNVSIESEIAEDGTEEIFVTLLSRKMHHIELEEFGHNDGSNS